jgi:hypothetical protein
VLLRSLAGLDTGFIEEKMLLVPGVQLDGVSVFVDGQEEPQAIERPRSEPLRDGVGEVER